MLPGHYQDPANRSTDLCNHRRGVKRVVGYCTRKPKCALQRGWLNLDDLHVLHLVLRNIEELRSRGLGGICGEGCHLARLAATA
jgi:hypothetical protein